MIGLLIITHETLGEAYLSMARHFFPHQQAGLLKIVSVAAHDDHDSILNRVNAVLTTPQWQRDVLVLTDIFGATPCNASLKLQSAHKIRVLTGLNTPMLIKALSHSETAQDVHAFAQEVQQAGIHGIILLDPPSQS